MRQSPRGNQGKRRETEKDGGKGRYIQWTDGETEEGVGRRWGALGDRGESRRSSHNQA